MQVDDALAEARLLRDGRDGRVSEAVMGDAADRGLDELLAPFFRRRRAPARDRGQLPFGVQDNPSEISMLTAKGAASRHHLTGFSASFNE
jgi:hypothetical protein